MTDDTDPTDSTNYVAPPEPELTPHQRVTALLEQLAAAVNTLPASSGFLMPRIQLPAIPRLTLTPPSLTLDEEPTPDPRHVAVTVRTVPVRPGAAELHTYRDAGGLTWQTYGAHDDFSTERMLEIQNSLGDIVATYPAGTWLHACYGDYQDDTGSQP